MEAYELLLAAVDKLEGLTPEQKAGITLHAKDLNTQLGTRGSDLLKLKSELGGVKEQVTTYKEFADTMAKFNMSAEDIKKAADTAGIQQTNDDTINDLKNILKETQSKLTASEKLVNVSKLEKTLKPKFDQAIKNYKDSEGKGFNFLVDFTDVVSKELFEGIKDGDDEVVVNDRISRALDKAKVDQENFMSRNGLASVDKGIHNVDERGGTGQGNPTGVNGQEILKILEDGGRTIDSVALAMSRADNAQK